MKFYYLALVLVVTIASSAAADSSYDACCSFPCQNRGVCLSKSNQQFTCDCTGLEYSGLTCEIPTVSRWIKNWMTPSLKTMHQIYTGLPWMWKVINKIPFLQRTVMRFVYLSRGAMVDSPPRYNTGYDYITTESHFNQSFYARSLPPVPKNCPTPMGVAGHEQLPDVDYFAEKFFKRHQFIPEPEGRSNVFFAFYAQHFSHQFFRKDHTKGPGFTMGNDGVDVSHIYGLDTATQNALRSFRNGKMKVRIIDGEEYPPLLHDAPGVDMIYPPHIPDDEKVALGHPHFSVLPGLFVMSSIWLREHNRICDILAEEHPDWDDDRLYHTTKLINMGQILKITIEEYVQHLSQYNIKLTYDPELLRDQQFQFSNRIHIEFAHLYHWHSLMPDTLTVNNNSYTMEQLSFKTQPVLEHGLAAFVHAFTTQPAGALNHHNHGKMTLDVFKRVVVQGRQLRLQSFNNYRQQFGMKRCQSFLELTGDASMAKELETIYGHIDALEFYPGLLLEKLDGSVTPFTMVSIGGPYAVKGMMANPLSSPQYWKPSTFGGEVGFDIVKSASIEKIFRQNMKAGQCRHIAFHLPEASSVYLEPSLSSTPESQIYSSSFSPSVGMHNTQYSTMVDSVRGAQCHADSVDPWSLRHHCNLKDRA